jgi:hypothetical protein
MIDTVTTNSPQSAPILTYRDIREEVENLGNLCRDSIKKELKGKYFSVTTDHWTSNANENYSCLTAHWIGEEYVMRHAVLGFYLHEGRTRGEDIANLFVQDFERYNFDLSYVVAIVTDTTGNMNTFGQHLRSLGVIHLYCVDHNLHLCAKLAFDDNNIPGSAQVMKTARSLCEYFDKSSQASDKLKAQQVAMDPDKCPLKLIQDVITRWWSTHRMIERLLLLHPFIKSLHDLNQIQGATPLTNDQLVILKDIKEMLDPMAKSQRKIEGENYVTVSLVPFSLYFIQRSIKDKMNDNESTPSSKHLAKVMYNDFTNYRYGNTEQQMFYNPVLIGRYNRYVTLHPVHLAATVLDPRMKELHFISIMECTEIWTYIRTLLLEHSRKHYDDLFAEVYANNNIDVQEDSEITLNNLEVTVDTEIQYYKTLPAPNGNRINPLTWWKEKSHRLPLLKSLALKLLTIPATSAASERCFSIAARILVKSRNRLSPELVCDLMFLKENGCITKKYVKDRILPTVYEDLEDDSEERRAINELLKELEIQDE